MKFGLAVIVIVVLLNIILTGSFAAAQSTTTGEIYGGVIDRGETRPLPDASMTLENLRNGRPVYGRTNSRGNYVFSLVPPGAYKVRAEKQEYLGVEYPRIDVPLNQPKLVLPVFALSRTPSTAPTQTKLLPATKATVFTLYPSAQIPPLPPAGVGLTSLVSLRDWALRSNFDSTIVPVLPLRRGRSFDQLALFAPGVARAPFSANEGPAVAIGVGSIGQFSVNGLRSRSNNFTVDGSDNNDEDIGVRRQGFVALVPQSAESIEEFQIITAGFPAHFGRNSGSNVNAVSRSGDSDIHGAAYGFFNDASLNARDPFDTVFTDSVNKGNLNGGDFTRKEFRHSQYGGVIGGPILPKRLFYFASGERQRTHGTALRHFGVPTDEERGLRVNPRLVVDDPLEVPGFVPIDRLQRFFDTQRIDYSSAAGESVMSLYPRPNNPAGPFKGHNYSQTGRSEGASGAFSTRFDWYPSIHSFETRYNSTDDESRIPFTGEAINSAIGTQTRTRNLSIVLNSSAVYWANALRVSYGRTNLAFPPEKGSPLLFGSPAKGVPSDLVREVQTKYGRFGPFGVTGPIGQLSILPYAPIGVDVYNFPQGRVDNTYQVSDFVTHIGNAHIIKAGFDIRHSQLNSFADRNSRPWIVFGYGRIDSTCLPAACRFATDDGTLHGTDLAALGGPSAVLQALSTQPSADTTIGLRLTQYDLFVQDDWELRATLTLNLGLRYELQTVPRETNNRIERTFGIRADQFEHIKEADFPDFEDIIRSGNQAFDEAVDGWRRFLAGRRRIYDADHRNFAPRIGFAWDPSGRGKTAIHAGYLLQFDANPGAFTSQSRNVFPTFVPVNLDLNFLPSFGASLNNPAFFKFNATQSLLIKPGNLNVYNLSGPAFATGLGTLFNQQIPNPAGDFTGNGLAFTLPQRNLKTAYAQQFVISAEQQFGNNWLGSIAYVGTGGRHLPRFRAPNGGLISTPLLLSSRDEPLALGALPPNAGAVGRPFPSLGAFNVMENSASSTYHSMQLAVLKRLSRGLQLRSSWTWSHTIDDVSDMFDTRSSFALPADNIELRHDRASASFDVRHRVTGFVTWNAFHNWDFALTAEFQTGQPYTINTIVDSNGDGTLTDRVNVGRNTSRAKGIQTVDAALSRSIRLHGSQRLVARIEAFNVFNHPNFGIPVRIREAPGFDASFDTQVDPRSLRLAVKLAF